MPGRNLTFYFYYRYYRDYYDPVNITSVAFINVSFLRTKTLVKVKILLAWLVLSKMILEGVTRKDIHLIVKIIFSCWHIFLPKLMYSLSRNLLSLYLSKPLNPISHCLWADRPTEFIIPTTLSSQVSKLWKKYVILP